MPVTAEQLAGFIGLDLEKIEDENGLKDAFDGAFVRREHAHNDEKIISRGLGKVNDIARRKLGRLIKEAGLGIELDEERPLESIDAIGDALRGSIESIKTELAEAKKGAKTPKEVEDLKAQLDAIRKENEAFKGDAVKWQEAHDKLKNGIETEKREKAINDMYEGAYGSIEFRGDLPKAAIVGFKTMFREAYRPEVDADGVVKWVDKEGKIVMDGTKAQTFRSGDSIAKEWAEKEKLTGAAPAPVKKTITPTSAGMGGHAQTPAQAPQHARPGRRVMPV